MNYGAEVELEAEFDTTIVDSIMLIVGIVGCACLDIGTGMRNAADSTFCVSAEVKTVID